MARVDVQQPVGELVRRARLERGFSVRHAADAAHVSRVTWKNVEVGRTQPRAATLVRMAEGLGMPRVAFIVKGQDQPTGDLDRGPGSRTEAAPHPSPPAAAHSHPTGLEPGLTFETFVVGAGNRFAHAAAQAVAEAPAASHNPLFIHGPNSLGKTHLLHAIGNDVRVRFPDRAVKCLTTERFLYDFVSTIQHGTGDEFRRRYREVDVLLIDDVGFLDGKPGVQEEFFHTFDHLLRCKTQLVLTSAAPPAAITTLMGRLTDRYADGLVADLQEADHGTRLAILRQKAEAAGVQPPAEVLELLAATVPGSIRELEGAMTRVLAHHRLQGRPLTVAATEKILADVIPTRSGHSISRARDRDRSRALRSPGRGPARAGPHAGGGPTPGGSRST